MEKVIDKFYNGNMSNFGFGTLGLKGPNITNNKVMTPKSIPSKNNNRQTIFNPNKSLNSINILNSRYNASQTLFNNPVPKTQYSIGLQVPTTSDPLTAKALTIPYQPPLNNTTQNLFEPTKKYFKPEILKVHMLEQKIKEMEENHKADKRRMREIIEGNVLNINSPPPRQQTVPNIDNNINNNPNSLEQAMNNLRNQNGGILDYSQKQALRRQQIQLELNQAREKLKNDKFFNGDNKTETETEEEEEEEEEESDKLLNPEGAAGGLLGLGARPDDAKQTKMSKMNKTTKKDEDGKELNPAEEEANEFIHNIPDHVALKLQADNFKVRANLAQVKDGFRNIRNQLEDKLEALQMAQRLNFEKIRFIIEQGGSKKMNAGIKKLLDGEDIDINNVEEDTPEYIKNLPNLIEEKLKKNEEKRKEEENQEKLEEQQMMDDEIGQRFNVTNQDALGKINPDEIKLDNVNEKNPWEIINTENDYEYIPGKGITIGNIKKGRIGDLNKNVNSYKNNLNGQRVFTEEQENLFVNKVAEKIFTAIKHSPLQVQLNNGKPIGGDMSNINKNFDEWLSDFENERKNLKTSEVLKKSDEFIKTKSSISKNTSKSKKTSKSKISKKSKESKKSKTNKKRKSKSEKDKSKSIKNKKKKKAKKKKHKSETEEDEEEDEETEEEDDEETEEDDEEDNEEDDEEEDEDGEDDDEETEEDDEEDSEEGDEEEDEDEENDDEETEEKDEYTNTQKESSSNSAKSKRKTKRKKTQKKQISSEEEESSQTKVKKKNKNNKKSKKKKNIHNRTTGESSQTSQSIGKKKKKKKKK